MYRWLRCVATLKLWASMYWELVPGSQGIHDSEHPGKMRGTRARAMARLALARKHRRHLRHTLRATEHGFLEGMPAQRSGYGNKLANLSEAKATLPAARPVSLERHREQDVTGKLSPDVMRNLIEGGYEHGGEPVGNTPKVNFLLDHHTLIDELKRVYSGWVSWAQNNNTEAPPQNATLGTEPFSAAPLMMTATEPCGATEENLALWEDRSDNVTDFIETWRRRLPESIIQIDDGFKGCMAEDRSTHPAKHILTLVHHSPPDICLPEVTPTAMSNFYDVPQHFFRVSGPLAQRSPVRSYGVVWPAVCSKHDGRCPLVVSLQGASEHAAFPRNWYDYKKMANTGLLRTVEWDPACLRKLRAVMIFPQLLTGESWVKDGFTLVDDFLVPLVTSFLGLYTGSVEIRQVRIVGYSEGAFGVLHAVTRYPQIFDFGAAIAVSLNSTSWAKVEMPTPPRTTKKWRLKALALAFAELDFSGEQSINLDNAVGMLEAANMSHVPLIARYYAGVGHNHWKNVFNKWPAFHRLIWEGNMESLAGL